MRTDRWIEAHAGALRGKTVVMTGATGAIGTEILRALCRLGAYVILLDRNAERSEALREDVFGSKKDERSERIPTELSDPFSVRRAAEALKDRPVDVILYAAGAYSVPRKTTVLGVNNLFQINFVSAYYLIETLLPSLRERSGKAVIVGSIAYRAGRFSPNDPDFQKKKSAVKVYGNSKRWLMASCYEAFTEEPSARLAVTHPGISFTNITRGYPKAVRTLIKWPMKILFPSPKKACLPILQGIFDETAPCEWIGPGVFNVWGAPKKQTVRGLQDDERAAIRGEAEQFLRRMNTGSV